MAECAHENIIKKRITRTFLDHKFSTEGRGCSACGASLWDDKVSDRFYTWLNNLKINNQRQYKLSERTDKLLKKFGEQYHCKDESKLIRAIIAVMNSKLSSPEYNAIFGELMVSADFKSLDAEPTNISKKVRITSPKSLYDLENWKDINHLNDSELIRNYIMIILVASKQTNSKFADFWNNQVKGYLEVALAAA